MFKGVKAVVVINDFYGKGLTNHRVVILSCAINMPVRGHGYWKLNISLL